MSAQEDATIVGQMIEWLGLEGDEASSFMSEVMSRKGHKAVTSWADGDGKPDKKPSNVLGITSGGQKKAAGAGWQY